MALPDFDLDGEVIALTGGAGILGRRFAKALADRGARVAVLDRAAFAGHDEAVRGYVCDAAKREELSAAARRIEGELGTVTGLVNAAATKSEHFFAPFET